MAETESIKYKDPNQPVAVRVKDLLGRMSLEEKIGQMVQIDRSVANAEVMKTYYIGKIHLYQSFYLMCIWYQSMYIFRLTHFVICGI